MRAPPAVLITGQRGALYHTVNLDERIHFWQTWRKTDKGRSKQSSGRDSMVAHFFFLCRRPVLCLLSFPETQAQFCRSCCFTHLLLFPYTAYNQWRLEDSVNPNLKFMYINIRAKKWFYMPPNLQPAEQALLLLKCLLTCSARISRRYFFYSWGHILCNCAARQQEWLKACNCHVWIHRLKYLADEDFKSRWSAY